MKFCEGFGDPLLPSVDREVYSTGTPLDRYSLASSEEDGVVGVVLSYIIELRHWFVL